MRKVSKIIKTLLNSLNARTKKRHRCTWLVSSLRCYSGGSPLEGSKRGVKPIPTKYRLLDRQLLIPIPMLLPSCRSSCHSDERRNLMPYLPQVQRKLKPAFLPVPTVADSPVSPPFPAALAPAVGSVTDFSFRRNDSSGKAAFSMCRWLSLPGSVSLQHLLPCQELAQLLFLSQQ